MQLLTDGPPEGAADDGPRPTGVLVVDDNSVVCTLLKTTLEMHGFTAFTAFSGMAAEDVYRRHHRSIDLVLLDVRMPDRDGPETLTALRQVNPAVCACFMTADPSYYHPELLIRMGAARLFQKPFQMAEFVRAVRGLTQGTGESAG